MTRKSLHLRWADVDGTPIPLAHEKERPSFSLLSRDKSDWEYLREILDMRLICLETMIPDSWAWADPPRSRKKAKKRRAKVELRAFRELLLAGYPSPGQPETESAWQWAEFMAIDHGEHLSEYCREVPGADNPLETIAAVIRAKLGVMDDLDEGGIHDYITETIT